MNLSLFIACLLHGNVTFDGCAGRLCVGLDYDLLARVRVEIRELLLVRADINSLRRRVRRSTIKAFILLYTKVRLVDANCLYPINYGNRCTFGVCMCFIELGP
jgi:hypothetical protein